MGQPWAKRHAQTHAGQVIGLPWVVLGEFWHGDLRANHDPKIVAHFLSIGRPLLDPASALPPYARLCGSLQASRRAVYHEIGQNDLWIAATALAADLPLVTANARHFGEIEGLKLEVAQ